jgi:hypothetical protein
MAGSAFAGLSSLGSNVKEIQPLDRKLGTYKVMQIILPPATDERSQQESTILQETMIAKITEAKIFDQVSVVELPQGNSGVVLKLEDSRKKGVTGFMLRQDMGVSFNGQLSDIQENRVIGAFTATGSSSERSIGVGVIGIKLDGKMKKYAQGVANAADVIVEYFKANR